MWAEFFNFLEVSCVKLNPTMIALDRKNEKNKEVGHFYEIHLQAILELHLGKTFVGLWFKNNSSLFVIFLVATTYIARCNMRWSTVSIALSISKFRSAYLTRPSSFYPSICLVTLINCQVQKWAGTIPNFWKSCVSSMMWIISMAQVFNNLTQWRRRWSPHTFDASGASFTGHSTGGSFSNVPQLNLHQTILLQKSITCHQTFAFSLLY